MFESTFAMTPVEISEYNAYLDETTESITDDELEAMHRDEVTYQQSLYQTAKARFSILHPFSQPDSLTRRGTMLIARRKLTIDQARNGAVDDWRSTINRLFRHAVTIYDIDIDRKYNLRVRFTPHSLVQLHDGTHCTGAPADVDWLSWCAERRVGG